MLPPVFPPIFWGPLTACFHPNPPAAFPSPVRAAVVIALSEGRFVVADIAGRGWCTPSGHLEEGETPEQAVRREAREEVGATLGELQFLGCFTLKDPGTGDSQTVPTYVASVLALDALPSDTESRGVRLLTLTELSTLYYTWDALLESVFRYALDTWVETLLGNASLPSPGRSEAPSGGPG